MSIKDSERKKEKEKTDAMSNFASSLLNIEEDDKEARKEILRDGVEERETIDKKTLGSSKVVTGKLSSIREEAGLSAFVGTSGKIKPPKLRKKEFYRLLAREILLIGRDELTKYGGLLSIDQIYSHFKETRENWEIKKDHIIEGIKQLEEDEMIPGRQKIGDLEIVQFKAMELSKDSSNILSVAKGVEVTFQRLEILLGWSAERVKVGVTQLASTGIAVIDGESIHFPGL